MEQVASAIGTKSCSVLTAAEYQRLIEDYYYGENGQTPVSEEENEAASEKTQE